MPLRIQTGKFERKTRKISPYLPGDVARDLRSGCAEWKWAQAAYVGRQIGSSPMEECACVCRAKAKPSKRGSSACGTEAVRVRCGADPSRPASTLSSTSQPLQSRSHGQYRYRAYHTKANYRVLRTLWTSTLYFLQICTDYLVSTKYSVQKREKEIAPFLSSSFLT